MYHKDKFFFADDKMITVEFKRNAGGAIEKLLTHSRIANEIWNKTNRPVPTQSGIKVDEKILETYVGEYEITPELTFVVTKEQDRLFLQATGQDKFEIFAEAENKFFLKVNDAQLEFVKADLGKVVKAILNQGGRQTDAKKIK